MNEPTQASPPDGSGAAPQPPSRLKPFMRGVIVGVVLLNALTLLASAFGATFGGFVFGMGATLIAAILYGIRGERAVAAGLVVALVLSPLLAFPACSLGFKGW